MTQGLIDTIDLAGPPPGSPIEIIKPLQFLLKEPWRYKVLYGGRGGAKTESIARSLLILGAQNPHKILCCREIQRSIKDSVHETLSLAISALGMSSFYTVLETEIRGMNGTRFFFSGLSNQTVDSIRSYPGITIVWAEEASNISKRSLSVLFPTIRAENIAFNYAAPFPQGKTGYGSEIWISFNPELETDEVFKMFVTQSTENAKVVKVGYEDNPFFPLVLEQLRQSCLKLSAEEHSYVWGGQPRVAVAGAVFGRELMEAQTGGRITLLPYDPLLKVHTVWDLGFRDHTAILLVQRQRSEVRIVGYLEAKFKDDAFWASLLNSKRLNFGTDYLPADGAAHHHTSGLSCEKILKAHGRKVYIIPRIPVEEGLRIARTMFPTVYFDNALARDLEPETGGYNGVGRLLECLKRYRRKVDTNDQVSAPIHDEYSHGVDAFRYLAQIVGQLRNDTDKVERRYRPERFFDKSMGLLG